MKRYFDQARLMLSVLPIVGQERCFALKGGTALKYFYFDMPRLSVDIDLTYIPLQPRDETLENIAAVLGRISDRITGLVPGCRIQSLKIKNTDFLSKLIVGNGGSIVKIEPNLILRGACYSPVLKPLCQRASDIFKMEMEVPVLSLADLYAGKICAALDRQHPRDLYDILQLLDTAAIDEKICKAFVVYLASHNRPMAELLAPNFLDFRPAYENEFKGMVSTDVSYGTLEDIQKKLPGLLLDCLSGDDKEFLLSVKAGHPDFSRLSVPGAEKLPAVQWKVQNILNMVPQKRKQAEIKLRAILGG